MKIVSIEIGRATQPVVPDEMKPLGGSYVPENIRLVADRYGFAAQPSYDDTLSGGAKFGGGRLISAAKKINISELIIFSNAIQVSTNNTTDADYVLDDILAWAKSMLGYREPQTKLPRLYESHIIVDFERDVDRILIPFESLRVGFGGALTSTYGLQLPITLTSFGVGADPLQIAAQMPPPFPGVLKPEFGLVRRLNHPYTEKRFFSLAPLQTEAHIVLLQEFESALPI